MDFHIEIDQGDLDRFTGKLDALDRAVAAELEVAMQVITLQIQATAMRLAPVDTGTLRSSLAQEVEQEAPHIVAGVVGSNVEYAPFVEMGTSSMDAHPFLRPAFEAERPFVERRIKQAFRDAKRRVQ